MSAKAHTEKKHSTQASTAQPPHTLYLIDGHAQIFRAYYAIRTPMTSPVTGEPTNAVFAFTGMLLKLFDQLRPQYVAMPIDTEGPTFREDLYKHYKANREQAPDELIQQFDRVFEVTRLFGIPLIGAPGAEADDVIATVTQRVLGDPALVKVQIRIVSKDKDLEQLLGPRVTMFDIHTDTTIDADWLWAHKGITPQQVVDVLALAGDKVDNVPGVEGIGPKTAAKLVQEYESLDGVLANLDKIKGKRRENLEKARDTIRLSRQLVMLKRNVPIRFSLEDAKIGAIDATALRRLFKQLGFNRHQADLEKLLGQPDGQRSQGDAAATLFDSGHDAASAVQGARPDDRFTTTSDDRYEAITTKTQLNKLVATLGQQEILSVDTETVGLSHRAPLCGISLAWEPGHGVYVPVRSPQPDQHLDATTVLNALGPVLEDPNLPKTGQNLKYDILVLRHAGIDLQAVAFDSLIASHLLGCPAHSLDNLALALLNHEMTPISRLIGPRPQKKAPGGAVEQRQLTMDRVPLDQITPYAAEDADIALRLFRLFKTQIHELGMDRLVNDVEMPLVSVLAEMEFHGIRVDPKILGVQKRQLTQRIIELRQQIQDTTGRPFNVDSPKQLADTLFGHLGLPVIKRTKTGPSTDVEVLETLCDHPDLSKEQARIPRLIVEYRQLTKLVNTYLDNLRDSIDPDTGRIHATFLQTGAATGRLSSNNPNLQNVPVRTEVGRQIRRAFVAEPEHVLISADYSQIELRVLAHLSQDPGLLTAFAKDMDIHTAVAAQVFATDPSLVTPEQRHRAKIINFGIIYGISAFGLARRVDSLDLKGARDLIAGYRKRFVGIDAFLASCIAQANEKGYVTTILGRRRAIPQIRSGNRTTRGLGERLAINTVVQGSAADLIKLAMVNLHRRIKKEGLPLHLLLQIHDELVLEAPCEDAPHLANVVRDEMQSAMRLTVPLRVDLGMGPNWLEAK